MSTDWSKYAEPRDCRRRASAPQNNGVVALLVGGVRKCEQLSVKHTPAPGHKSHADVLGMPSADPHLMEVRHHLFKMVGPDGWAIRPDDPWVPDVPRR